MYKRLHASMIAPAKRGVPVLLHVFAVEIISIHAPMWGRALKLTALNQMKIISIHAPVWGRASYLASAAPGRGHFNSRPRVGAGAAVC